MFFDDRLATVLRQEGASESARRTQFRQLLDILGNRKFGPAGRRDLSLVAAAWLRMDALARAIPASERAAMIREQSWRFRSADLAAHLADFEPEVASAALNRAQLSAEDWSALIPRLPVRARGFLRLRKDLPIEAERLLDRLGVSDRGLPSPSVNAAAQDDPTLRPLAADPADPRELDNEVPPEERPAPFGPDPIETGRSEISALVERIARFKRTREAIDPDALSDSERSPRLPLGEFEPAHERQADTFGFCADAAGRIEWADPEAAPMVIGMRLVAPPTLGDRDRETALERAFLARQPIVQASVELAGAPAIAGEWSVDAEPRFTLEGHFTGYVGRFRRPAQTTAGAGAGDEAMEEADRIRQLLHELRTPVTAVQGYAEVIQQQLFGPAPHEYRALAAAIAADAAHILAGFEELDRLARLELGTVAMEPGETDLAALARQTVVQLAQVLSPRMAGIELELAAPGAVLVALDSEETELLVWRFLATLGGACGANETLAARLSQDTGTNRLSARNGAPRMSADNGAVRLVCDLPGQLIEAADIFNAEAKPGATAINTGVFGAGFALRLARAEARASGGDLLREGDRLALVLPLIETLAHDPPLDQQAGRP